MITRNRADFTKQDVGSEKLSLRVSTSSVQMAPCLQSGRRVYATVVARRLGQSQTVGAESFSEDESRRRRQTQPIHQVPEVTVQTVGPTPMQAQLWRRGQP